MAKPKVAFYWCASCGGCEESVVDLAEELLGVTSAVDVVFWPVALDFKRKDVEALPDKAITATFLNGAIRMNEQEEMARLLRRKSQVMIAYGACAQSGGIPSLANQFSREHILRYVYEQAPTVVNPGKTRPQAAVDDGEGHKLTLPVLRDGVRSLDQVVEVDYTIPGCAPPPALLAKAVQALLSGKLPPKGTVLAPDVALCDECPRKETKPAEFSFTEFKRPHQIIIEQDRCMLAQGLVCMGPATRSGCGAACTTGNMPCTGCMGPTSRVRDHGAKMLSSITSNVAATEEADIDKALAGIPDPTGTFWRYGMAKSLLRRKLNAEE